MATINFAVEITTDETGVTDADYGCVAGVFRFVTGKPGYDGSPTYPTGETGIGSGVLEAVWYENYISVKDFSNPNRSIDITTSGNYGSLSGFSFGVLQSQAALQFAEFIIDFDIHLINRRVQLYIVVDDVFFYGWGGAIKNTTSVEEVYKVTCQDLFRAVHKMMPPRIISPSGETPSEQSEGDPMPVTAGDVQYTKIANITGDSTYVKLAEDAQGNPLYAVPILDGTILVPPTLGPGLFRPDVTLITTNHRFAKSELVGKHLFAVYGDDVPDKTLGFKIKDSAKTTGRGTDLSSFESLSQTIVATYDNWGVRSHTDARSDYKDIFYEYTPANPVAVVPTRKWFFKVADLSQTYQVSDSAILAYLGADTGQMRIYTYSEDEKKYIDISELVEAIDVDESTITLTSVRNISNEGEIQVARPIPIEFSSFSVNWDYPENYVNGVWVIGGPYNAQNTGEHWSELITDRDRSTYATCKFLGNTDQAEWKMTFNLPANYDYSNFNKIFCGFDFDVHGGDEWAWYGIRVQISAVDVFGRTLEGLTTDRLWPSSDDEFATQERLLQHDAHYNFIPNSYYDQGGNSNSEDSQFNNYANIFPVQGGEYRYLVGGLVAGNLNRNFLELPTEILDAQKDGMVNSVEVRFRLVSWTGFDDTHTLLIKQFALWGLTNVSLVGDELFTPISGQVATGDVPSNTVFGCYKLILEDLDGIDSGDIDYGNVETARGGWHVGRQFVDRKNSYTYLMELCQQSMVALYPTRAGKRGLTAWLDDESSPATHNTATILRDSIKKVTLTPIEKMYTDYYIEYNWDPGLEKFTRVLYVTKAEADAFPGVDDNTWTEYAGGMEGIYADAKDMWEIVHGAYQIASAITPDMPKSLSQLSYYIDTSTLEGNPYPQYNGTNSSAMKYLRQLVYWTARQKVKVDYSLPLTAANIQLEMMQRVEFVDDVLTNGDTYEGWVTKLALDLKNNKIDVQLTLLPLDYLDAQSNIIIERGSALNADTIVESGSQPDQYEETGV